MKCLNCGHEPKEEQPNFCCKCGHSLRTILPSSVNQEVKHTVISYGSGDHAPTCLNVLEPGKELIAETTIINRTSDQSKLNKDEPQSLKDTGPPVKKRKKRNRKKNKKKTDGDFSFVSLPTNLEDSNIIESDNDDECESLTDPVIGESTQPTALTIENADATDTPDKTGSGTTEPKDGKNPKDVPLDKDKNKKEAQDGKPKVSSSEKRLDSTKKKDPESMVTSSANLDAKNIPGSGSKKDTSNIGNTYKISTQPDTDKKTTSSERTLEVESKNKKTKHKVPPAHNANKRDEKVDATTKISTDEEKNNNCGQVHNTGDGKICENEPTKPENKNYTEKETDGSTKDISADSSNTLNRKDSIKNEAQQKGDTKNNNEDIKKDKATEHLQSEIGKNDNEEKNKDCAQENKHNENASNDKTYETEPTIKPNNKTVSENNPGESINVCPPDSVNTSTQKNIMKKDEKVSKNKNNKTQQKGNSEDDKKGKTATNLQSGVGKSSNEAKINDKEGKEALKRETEDCITLYFHVIVSKNFGVKVEEDKVIVKGGQIKGYKEWSDAICTMHYTKGLTLLLDL